MNTWGASDHLGPYYPGRFEQNLLRKRGQGSILPAGKTPEAARTTLLHEAVGHGLANLRDPEKSINFLVSDLQLSPAFHQQMLKEARDLNAKYTSQAYPAAKEYGQREAEAVANAFVTAITDPLLLKREAPYLYEATKAWFRRDPQVPFELLPAVAPLVLMGRAASMDESVDEQVFGARRE